MPTSVPRTDASGMLTEADFHIRYPGVVALSANGDNKVTSALTGSLYIVYNHQDARYESTSRWS